MGKKNMTTPVILNEGTYTKEDLVRLRHEQSIWREADLYESQLAELFEVLHPELMRTADFEQQQKAFIESRQQAGGSYVYLPWSGNLLHIVSETDLSALVTNRNKNLITEDEQRKLKESAIGVLGMSVGNGIALAMAYSGIGKTLKIADFDKLETCNLNRLRAGMHNIGKPKITVAAEQIYEINPYLQVTQFPDGVNESDLGDFISGHQPLSIVFDEIDDFVMKIRLRQYAAQVGVPVIMLTSLGDNILIDIERYDLDSSTPIFNGLLGSIPNEILEGEIGEKEKVKYAVQLVGLDYIPTRALQSLLEINKSLVGRPQLYSTIAIDGGLAAYLARRLLLGEALASGRHYLSLGKALGLEENADEQVRRSTIDTLEKLFL